MVVVHVLAPLVVVPVVPVVVPEVVEPLVVPVVVAELPVSAVVLPAVSVLPAGPALKPISPQAASATRLPKVNALDILDTVLPVARMLCMPKFNRPSTSSLRKKCLTCFEVLAAMCASVR